MKIYRITNESVLDSDDHYSRISEAYFMLSEFDYRKSKFNEVHVRGLRYDLSSGFGGPKDVYTKFYSWFTIDDLTFKSALDFHQDPDNKYRRIL
jgi:hypothetical protein